MNTPMDNPDGTSTHPSEDAEDAFAVHEKIGGASWNRTSDLSIISAAL